MAKASSLPKSGRGVGQGKSEGGKWVGLRLSGTWVGRSLRCQVEGHVGGVRKECLANGKSLDVLDSS